MMRQKKQFTICLICIEEGVEQDNVFTQAPNENGGVSGNNGNTGKEIKITRSTSVKDLFVPVTK